MQLLSKNLFAGIAALTMGACAGEGLEGVDDGLDSEGAGETSALAETKQPLLPFFIHEIRARHSNKCIDVPSSSQSNSVALTQYDCHGGNNQRFRANPLLNGAWEIRAIHSNKCLDVWGGWQNNGAALSQYDCHGGPNQQFDLRDLGNGFFEIKARHSGKCIDVDSSSQANGAAITQYDCHGNLNQQWSIKETGV